MGLAVRRDAEPLGSLGGFGRPPLLLIVDPAKAESGDMLRGLVQRAYFRALPDVAMRGVAGFLDAELVTVHTTDAQYLSALSLQELESRLPGDRFARVHRRALVNLEHVVRLEPNEVGGYTAHTRGGRAVEVSRQAARDLRKRLGLR